MNNILLKCSGTDNSSGPACSSDTVAINPSLTVIAFIILAGNAMRLSIPYMYAPRARIRIVIIRMGLSLLNFFLSSLCCHAYNITSAVIDPNPKIIGVDM